MFVRELSGGVGFAEIQIVNGSRDISVFVARKDFPPVPLIPATDKKREASIRRWNVNSALQFL